MTGEPPSDCGFCGEAKIGLTPTHPEDPGTSWYCAECLIWSAEGQFISYLLSDAAFAAAEAKLSHLPSIDARALAREVIEAVLETVPRAPLPAALKKGPPPVPVEDQMPPIDLEDSG